MTDENTEETNRLIRQKEFERLCYKNHFEYVIGESIEQSLQKALIEYDPDAICLPSIVDWHIQKEKWEMFHHIYRSQTVISAFRFKLNELLWGQMFGEYAAEVFCVMDFDRWRHLKNVWSACRK